MPTEPRPWAEGPRGRARHVLRLDAGFRGGLRGGYSHHEVGVAAQARVCAVRVDPHRIISHRNRCAGGYQVAAGDREISRGVFGQVIVGFYCSAGSVVRAEGTDLGSDRGAGGYAQIADADHEVLRNREEPC
jgi:hypothetical protein